jgi:hypothetical protein
LSQLARALSRARGALLPVFVSLKTKKSKQAAAAGAVPSNTAYVANGTINRIVLSIDRI